MKKNPYILLNVLILLFIKTFSSAQTLSPNTVTYRLTYDNTKNEYTAWVVPNYNTPNTFNTGTNELAPTAQVTIALPTSNNITSITDVNGTWTKPGGSDWRKFGPNELPSIYGNQGLDINTSYYTLGKSASETNFGPFVAGTPVALFKFTTSSCSSFVRIISKVEPVVTVALKQSYNVANSFNSLSGQAKNTTILEQFKDVSGFPIVCNSIVPPQPAAVITIIPEIMGSTKINTPLVQNVLANDLINGSSATISNVVLSIPIQPANGTATVQADGTIKYVPNYNYTGIDCYTYKICDKSNLTNCSTANNCITVTPDVPTTSTNLVKYKITYDSTSKKYTVWVVPNYNTPNANNSGTNERGPTAQVTLAVPKSISITNIYDINGNWQKPGTTGFLKLSNLNAPNLYLTSGVDPSLAYYAIDKSTNETDYGPFVANVPTPLFSFTTDNCAGLIRVINTNDPVIQSALTSYSLNFGNSFYSLSGQSTLGNTNPLEQFSGVIGDGTASCSSPVTPPITPPVIVPKPKIVCSPKVWLQGALYGVTDSLGLMRDDLRVKSLIPLISPYIEMGFNAITKRDSIINSVLAVTGPNAIVDWVFVELRNALNSSQVIDSRAALLQRDGNVVDTDGVSDVSFDVAQAGAYFISIKHRNHLGVMSSIPTLLAPSIPQIIDFKQKTFNAFQKVQNIINQAGVLANQGLAMWAGNTLNDNISSFQGSNNDVNPIYQQIINASTNVFKSPFYILKGYLNGDLNMDGSVITQGSGNDATFIYQNVLVNHPGNSLKANFFSILQQLP